MHMHVSVCVYVHVLYQPEYALPCCALLSLATRHANWENMVSRLWELKITQSKISQKWRIGDILCTDYFFRRLDVFRESGSECP